MSKIRFVGLDVHADTIAIAVAEPGGDVRSHGVIGCWGATERKTGIRLLKQHRRGRPRGSAVVAALLFAPNLEPRTRIAQVD
jgi:hypothetical protein